VEGVEATACRIGSESDIHPKHFDVVKEILKRETIWQREIVS